MIVEHFQPSCRLRLRNTEHSSGFEIDVKDLDFLIMKLSEINYQIKQEQK